MRGDCNINDNACLRDNASNLAAYLYSMMQNNEKSFRLIEGVIHSVAPYFKGFKLHPDANNSERIRLEWEERDTDMYLDGYSFSDGTLRFIALTTLLLQPDAPKIIIIDEPELGLHPAAINKLAELVKRASLNSQIILSTQSEQEFVNSIITPYLFRFGIYDVRPILIHTSRSGRGGMVNFEHLNNTVKMLLQSVKNDFIVTTFIDFFRLPHNMPKYDECIAVTDKNQELNMLENAVTDYICDRRFFAYIQKHEFEALLFSDNKGFEYYFPDECAKQTATIVSSYDSPEDINSTPSGAPSKQLAAIKPDYNKVLESNLIAMEIGINVILERCPRFALWIKKIIDKAVI